MSIFSKLRDAFRTIANIPKMIGNAISNAIEKMFRVPLDGIMTMIENFKRIICFLESMPLRTRNVSSGVGNIFLGVEKKVEAVGKSINAGLKSTGTLFAYGGEYAGSRVRCVVKFIQNFYKCIFFYVLKMIGGILKVIILKPIAYVGDIIGVDMEIIFERVGNAFIEFDIFLASIFGFHLIYFPESVRADCFTCVRLKGSAVSNRADELNYTFKTDIPRIMGDEGGDYEFRRAKNQFNESSVTVPRQPYEVK